MNGTDSTDVEAARRRVLMKEFVIESLVGFLVIVGLIVLVCGCSSPTPPPPQETCLGTHGSYCRATYEDKWCTTMPFVYAYDLSHEGATTRTVPELADEYTKLLATECIEKKATSVTTILCCRTP